MGAQEGRLLTAFFAASGIVVPLLERVKKAREVYRLSSRGEYDIVTAANLTELAKLLTALEAFADD